MNHDDTITLERLAAMLDAYGGDARRWPASLRAPAEALIASDPEARRLHEATLALDALLDEAPALKPSRALKAGVLRRAAPPLWRQGLASLWPFGPAWQPAAALALIAALGIAVSPIIGSSNGQAASGDPDSLVFGDGPYGGDLP